MSTIQNLVSVFANVPMFQILLGLGVFYFVFVFWYEGKKDGFDIEHIFDFNVIFFFLNLSAYLYISTLYERLKIYHYNHILLWLDVKVALVVGLAFVTLFIVFVLSKIWQWSVFRVLDILSISINFFLIFISLGFLTTTANTKFGGIALLLIFFYQIFQKKRSVNYFSGFVFSLFLLFVSFMLIFLSSLKGNLLLISILFTIAVGNLYFRNKRMIIKSYLPSEFLKNLKDKLMRKDKDLKAQQKLLADEDSYMQPGRADDNSESMDEAILEDSRKEITDASLTAVRKLRNEVRRALSLMKLGRYGVCQVCGQPIDKSRLQVYPEATKCISCANKADR